MKRLISFFALIAVWATSAYAYEFMVDGLCYNRHSDGNSVYVTWQKSSSPRYTSLSEDVNIPPSVTYNGKSYPVTEIDYDAFSGCTGITSVTIGNSVTSIGDYAFSGCSGLTTLTIPNSVTLIGVYAFYGCSELASLTIGNSVTSIGSWAFSGCSVLKTLVIGNSVKYIGDHAFKNCSGLTGSLTIPNSVTSIGDSAFYGCRGLTGALTIPNSVTSIGDYTFYGCSGLTSLTIPNSVTSIGYEAFYGCSGLTSVTIPNSVTSIGDSAFSSCSGLTSIVVESGNTKYDSRDNCNAIIKTGNNELICGCKNTVIPNSVTSIGWGAFYGCRGLTSVTIPNSVTSIGRTAFYNCSRLTSVTIPNSVTSIGPNAFEGCNNIQELVWNAKNCASMGNMPKTTISILSIGDGVETLPWAFVKGSKITSVTIPNSVTSIGNSAFSECNNLQNLIWNSKSCSSNGNMTTSNIIVVTIGDGVEILPNNFVENSKITTVTIPNSVTTIGASAFSGCSGLPSVEIPNSTTSIGASAFADCRLIQHVTIGSNVNAIGDNAFKNCKYLVDVTNYSVIPQEINANVFDGVDLSLCYLYVLENSYDYYIREAVWKDFNVRISGVEGVEVDAATKEVEGYYDLKGVRLEEPIRDQVNIVRYKDGTSQKVVIK